MSNDAMNFLHHEVKNGLNAAILIHQDIAETAAFSKQGNVTDAKDVETNTKHLIELIQQQEKLLSKTKSLLLAGQRIERIISGTYALSLNTANLNSLKLQYAFANVFTLINPASPQTSEAPGVKEAVESWVQVDTHLLYHIVSNAVDNANKYGAAPVTISLHSSFTSTAHIGPEDEGYIIFDFREETHIVKRRRRGKVRPADDTPSSQQQWLHVHIQNGAGRWHGDLLNSSHKELIGLFKKGTRGHRKPNHPQSLKADKSDEITKAESSGHGSWVMMKCLHLLRGCLVMDVSDAGVCLKVSVPVQPVEVSVPVQPKMHALKIAVLDDSPVFRKAMKRTIKKAFPNADVSVFGESPAEINRFPAQAMSQEIAYDVIVVDQCLSGCSEERRTGTSIVRELRWRSCTATIVMQSGSDSTKDINTYISAGADLFLPKDCSPVDLRKAIAYSR
jgi:CheY-like chemotaxis protein